MGDRNKKRYRATRKPNGRYKIFDVEMFAEHERFGHKFDKGWFDKAIQKHNVLHEEGHDPPLHVYHHDMAIPESEVPQVGTFRPTRYEERQLEGKKTTVVLCDLDEIPEEIYKEIEAGKYPYRSVEIGFRHFDDPMFDSLALLSSSAPFFKFPNLKPELDQGQQAVAGLTCNEGLVVRYDITQDSVATQFKFDDSGVVRYVEPTPAVPTSIYEMPPQLAKKKMSEEDKPESESESPSSGSAQSQSQSKPEQPAPPGMQPAVHVQAPENPEVTKAKAVAEITKALITALTQALNALNDTGGESKEVNTNDDDDSVVGGPVTMSEKTALTGQATVKILEGGKTPATASAEQPDSKYAELLGRIAALEAANRKYEQKAASQALIDKAKDELSKYGLTKDSLAELEAIAAAGGEQAVAAYVAAVKRYGTPDPDGSELDANPTPMANMDPVLQKYAAQGPEVLQAAMAAAAKYEAAPRSLKTMFSRESFINAQLVMKDREAQTTSKE